MSETPACSIEQTIDELVSQNELLSARVRLMTVKQELTVAALEKLTGEIEQMPTKLGASIEAAFEVGRRYAEAANGRERRLNAVPDNI